MALRDRFLPSQSPIPGLKGLIKEVSSHVKESFKQEELKSVFLGIGKSWPRDVEKGIEGVLWQNTKPLTRR